MLKHRGTADHTRVGREQLVGDLVDERGGLRADPAQHRAEVGLLAQQVPELPHREPAVAQGPIEELGIVGCLVRERGLGKDRFSDQLRGVPVGNVAVEVEADLPRKGECGIETAHANALRFRSGGQDP